MVLFITVLLQCFTEELSVERATFSEVNFKTAFCLFPEICRLR